MTKPTAAGVKMKVDEGKIKKILNKMFVLL